MRGQRPDALHGGDPLTSLVVFEDSLDPFLHAFDALIDCAQLLVSKG
jgi:hypothetical protein